MPDIWRPSFLRSRTMLDLSEKPMPGAAGGLHPVTPGILIVDDTPANVLLLVRMLTERGYKASTALSGKLALQAARTEPPDLILLDITMPEMNGYEVCAQFKADAALKEIPVIFISVLNETIDKVRRSEERRVGKEGRSRW